MTSPKVNNPTIKDLNNSEADKISNYKLKKNSIRMIMKLKRTFIST
jgi:hypothetical protein